MVLKVYLDPRSQPSRAVHILLKMNTVPFEEIFVDLSTGEQKSAWFTKINPHQLVPVLDHDGFILTEGNAILKYICRTFAVAPHWYPQNETKTVARIDEFLNWETQNLRPFGSLSFLLKVHPVHFAVEFLEAYGCANGSTEDNHKRFKSFLDLGIKNMKSTWLSKNEFIAGNQISIADLVAVEELEQPRAAGIKLPEIEAYMNKIRALLEPHYTNYHSVGKTLFEEALKDPARFHFLKA